MGEQQFETFWVGRQRQARSVVGAARWFAAVRGYHDRSNEITENAVRTVRQSVSSTLLRAIGTARARYLFAKYSYRLSDDAVIILHCISLQGSVLSCTCDRSYQLRLVGARNDKERERAFFFPFSSFTRLTLTRNGKNIVLCLCLTQFLLPTAVTTSDLTPAVCTPPSSLPFCLSYKIISRELKSLLTSSVRVVVTRF